MTDGHKIGVGEEGIITAIANLFRSNGDGLRAQLRAMGVAKGHAEQLEAEMDKGKIVILASTGVTFDGESIDKNISYFGYFPM